jgi:hypothetical protein
MTFHQLPEAEMGANQYFQYRKAAMIFFPAIKKDH